MDVGNSAIYRCDSARIGVNPDDVESATREYCGERQPNVSKFNNGNYGLTLRDPCFKLLGKRLVPLSFGSKTLSHWCHSENTKSVLQA